MTFTTGATASAGFTSTCFPRENKYKHYATFSLATGKAGFRLPEYVLVCNFPEATGEPGLMECDDVITFFHEYGHLIHGICKGNTKWATGDLENDFIEAPSQMFEEWPKDPAILKLFARHYKTNEPLPAELAEKARAADDFGRGAGRARQMFYAAISLDFYNRDPKGLDQDKLVAAVAGALCPLQVRRRHAHANCLRPSQRLLRGLLHLHVVTGHCKGYVHRVQAERINQSGGCGEIPQLDSRASGTKPAAEMVAGFSGTPVFVPGICGLVEREVENRRWPLAFGRWPTKTQPRISRISTDQPYFNVLDP